MTAGETFEGGAEEDESNVTVFGAGGGIGGERGGECGTEEFVARARLEEQFFVRGQAGGVGEQHAEGYVAAAEIGRSDVGEFGDSANDGGVELEKAAFVEDGGHRCGGDDFGKGGEIEERGGSDEKLPTLSQRTRQGWGNLDIFLFVSEVAERFQCDEFALVGDGYGGGREGTVSDGVAENCEGGGERLILVIESRERNWSEIVQARMLVEKSVTCAGYSRVGEDG